MGDIPAQLADLRRRDDVVEVPARLARIDDAMQWIIDACNRGAFDVDVSTGSLPSTCRQTTSLCPDAARREPGARDGVMVILVPCAVWIGWAATCAFLPTWLPSDEETLVQRAIDRGWSEGWAEIDLSR